MAGFGNIVYDLLIVVNHERSEEKLIVRCRSKLYRHCNLLQLAVKLLNQIWVGMEITQI